MNSMPHSPHLWTLGEHDEAVLFEEDGTERRTLVCTPGFKPASPAALSILATVLSTRPLIKLTTNMAYC